MFVNPPTFLRNTLLYQTVEFYRVVYFARYLFSSLLLNGPLHFIGASINEVTVSLSHWRPISSSVDNEPQQLLQTHVFNTIIYLINPSCLTSLSQADRVPLIITLFIVTSFAASSSFSCERILWDDRLFDEQRYTWVRHRKVAHAHTS